MKKVASLINQSTLEADACSWPKAREICAHELYRPANDPGTAIISKLYLKWSSGPEIVVA